MPESDESKREGRADTRDVRADARDDRAGARDTRADVRDVAAEARDETAGARDDRADVRESHVDEREIHVDALRHGLLRWVLFVAVVMTVLTLGSFVRSYQIGDVLDRVETNVHSLDTTSNEARTAAAEARDELRAAIARLEESNPDEPSLNNQDIIDALAAITRIEVALCGGPCPADEP